MNNQLTNKYPRVIICNIGRMKYYKGIDPKDDPFIIGAGKYTKAHNEGGEEYNFLPFNDDYIYGFVETNYNKQKENLGNYKFAHTIHLENIDKGYKRVDTINNVLVIFISYSEIYKSNVIIGFYENATVFRNRQPSIRGLNRRGNNFGYNLKCKKEDALLIKEEDRKFIFSKKNNDGTYNFGQINISYAYKDIDINSDRYSLLIDALNYYERMKVKGN